MTCNGYPVPLLATDNPDIHVGGVRYKAWQPPSALHPTITTDVPLQFELIDLTSGTSRGGCTYHVAHPGGMAYDEPPVNAVEAESRRARRFEATGFTPGKLDCPASGRSRHGYSPISARRAFSTSAACVPCSSSGVLQNWHRNGTRPLGGYWHSRRPLRRRPATGRVPQRARPGHTVRPAPQQLTWSGLRRIRRRKRQGSTRLDRTGRHGRRTRPDGAESAAVGGAQPDRQRRHHLHRGRSRQRPRPRAPTVEPGHAAGGGVRGRLGGAGGRAGAALTPARCRARRPVRTAQPAHRRHAATGTGVRPSRLRARGQRNRSTRPPPAFHARLRSQPAAERQLRGQRGLDAGTLRCGLCAGRPTRCRARGPRSLRADRAAAHDTVRAGTATGPDRRRPRRRPGPGSGGAQPGHLLRDRLRSGVSRYAAGFSAGGKRRSGGPRRQIVDALAGDAQTRRRCSSPRRRALRRPVGFAHRFPARGGRFSGGATPRDGDRRQHAGQRDPGKPWAAAFSARAGRAVTRRSPAAEYRPGVLGRYRQGTLAPADQSLVAVDQVHRRRGNPCRTDAFVAPADRTGRPDREHAVAVGRSGAAAVLLGADRPCRCVVVGRHRHAVVHGCAARWLRSDDRWRRLCPGARALRHTR